MRGGRDSVVATPGRDVLDLGKGRGDFATAAGGGTPASAPSGSRAARTWAPAGRVEP